MTTSKSVTPAPSLPLDQAARRSLKAAAHAIDPVVMIGADGLTASVLAETGRALDRHGLIKVRVLGDDREARAALFDEMCAQLGAAPVQHIGKILVIYRPPVENQPVEAPKAVKPAAAKPRKPLRAKPAAVPKRILGPNPSRRRTGRGGAATRSGRR